MSLANQNTHDHGNCQRRRHTAAGKIQPSLLVLTPAYAKLGDFQLMTCWSTRLLLFAFRHRLNYRL